MTEQIMTAMKERRKLERFDLRIPAKIELMTLGQEGRGEKIPNIMTSDICSGGAFFHTTQPLPEGTQVKIDLILPLNKLKKLKDGWHLAHIKVTGTVLRSESTGMAICFNENYQIRPWSGEQLTYH